MAHKGCLLHGMDPPETCAYCSPKGGRKSGITHIAPPPDYVDRDEGDRHYGGPEDEGEDLRDDIEPAEAAFVLRPPKARMLPGWDLRVSDTTPETPLTPKPPKHTRLPPLVTPEEVQEKKERAPIVEGNLMAIARRLEQLKRNKWTPRDIAASFNVSDAWVYQHLSLLKLTKRVQALIEHPRPESMPLNLTVAAALVTLPPHLQEEYAQEALRGRWTTANEAARHIRMRAQQERARARELSRPAG